MARRHKSWKKHLLHEQRVDRHEATLEATAIEARLQAQLPTEVWDEIEAEWQTKDDLDAYLPQQRRDYLIKAADRYDVSLAGV